MMRMPLLNATNTDDLTQSEQNVSHFLYFDIITLHFASSGVQTNAFQFYVYSTNLKQHLSDFFFYIFLKSFICF